jgi:hypothetical protein
VTPLSDRDRVLIEELGELLRSYGKAQGELLRNYGKVQGERLERALLDHHRAHDALVDRLLLRIEELLASPCAPQPSAAPPPRMN